jgi:alpha-glucosidase
MMDSETYCLSDSLRVEIQTPSSSSSSSSLSIPSITIINSYNNDIIWRSLSNQPFLYLKNNSLSNHPPILNGNYQIEELTTSLSDLISIDDVTQTDNILNIFGYLSSSYNDNRISYNMSLTGTNDNQIKLSISLNSYNQSDVMYLSYYCEQDEQFFGFGEQYSNFNLQNKRVPIVVSEQGVGRGIEPLSSSLPNGAGGNAFTTYSPKPLYITSYNRSIFLDISTISFFNLTSSTSNIVEVEVWNTNNVILYITKSDTFLHAIESMTTFTGRPSKRLPRWTQQGAVVGLEGGTKNVTRNVQTIIEGEVPVVAVWLQDWVGIRHGTDGDRLIWNWETNQDWYYNWTNMVNDFREKGIRVMNYVNPFFSNPVNLTSYIKNNFYQEGLTKGYFVKDKNNESYSMNSLTVAFYTLDLTNPAAVDWMKNKIIKNETIINAGSSGFMCDFGEYLPFDSVLYSGESASSYHNKYPEEWVKLVSEAISEMNATDEVVFFARSGYSHSPKYLNLFWLGDQLISYDSFDGMNTLISAALSVGLSGQSFVHCDIGGYNSFFSNTTKGMYFVRDSEILQRWTEFSAFGSSLFRTHIGASMNNINAQIYDNKESLAHFRKFAMIYSQLSDYRFELMDIAVNNGQPLMMPMLAQYFYDPDILKLPDPPEQYLFGFEFIVSPSMAQGETSNRIYIPANADIIH